MHILYLTHRVPLPPDKGDRIRSYHTLRHLASEHDVYLACLADEPVSDTHRRELSRLCRDLAIVPVDRRRWLRAAWSVVRGRTATEGLFAAPALRKALAKWSAQYAFDVALAYCSSMAQYLDLPDLRRLPAVADLVDLDSQKWLDYAASGTDGRLVGGLRRRLYRLEGRRLRRVETALTQRCRSITFVSDREADLYRQAHANDQTHVVPNGVDFDYFRPEAVPGSPKPFSCVFVGALDYHANVGGLLWFARDVWPTVTAKLPAATLTVVGRNPSPAVRALSEDPSIRVVANVPDVRPFLAGAAVAVVPLLIARGLQNKVLEAMAMQRPVVATPQALGGIAAVPGIHVLSAKTADQWIESLVNLLSDEAKQQQLGRAGRGFVAAHYDWKGALRELHRVLADAATSPQFATKVPRQRTTSRSVPATTIGVHAG